MRRGLFIADGAGYRFRHDLVREALNDSLLPGERRRLHGRLARVLDVEPDPDGQLIAELARHWWNAGDWEPALRTSLAAADEAMTVYAFDEALGQFERVLGACDRLAPADGVASVDRLEVLGRAADAAYGGAGAALRGIRPRCNRADRCRCRSDGSGPLLDAFGAQRLGRR